MATYTQITQLLGTALLEAARPLQDGVVQAIATLDGLAGKVPGLPEGSAVPMVDHLQGLPALPTAREVVSANFDLAERFLAAQRAFALRLVNTSAESARVFVPSQAGAPSESPAGAAV
jgi:ABC-type nitrate/sulfonate/bicarbonate transport system substrate-binding protein